MLYWSVMGPEPHTHPELQAFRQGFQLPCRNGFNFCDVCDHLKLLYTKPLTFSPGCKVAWCWLWRILDNALDFPYVIVCIIAGSSQFHRTINHLPKSITRSSQWWRHHFYVTCHQLPERHWNSLRPALRRCLGAFQHYGRPRPNWHRWVSVKNVLLGNYWILWLGAQCLMNLCMFSIHQLLYYHWLSLQIHFVKDSDPSYATACVAPGMIPEGKLCFRTCFQHTFVPISHVVRLATTVYPTPTGEPLSFDQAFDHWLLC